MSEISDNVLVDRVVYSDDKHAFAELVKRYQSMLRYSLRQMTGWNESLADELAQEALLKAYTSINKFRKDSKFSTWLYKIALNLFRSDARLKQLDTVVIGHDTVAAVEAEASSEFGLHRDLSLAMATLSVEQRSVIHLSLHRECTHQEISDIMGMPLGTVKTHINRGRKQLQRRLVNWRGSLEGGVHNE